jgi:leucine dehydrogenase
MQATAKHVFGSPDLKGLRINLLGVGHVGFALAEELHRHGATLFLSDLQTDRLERAVKAFGATALSDRELIRKEADIFAPCGLGAILNDETIPQLRVKAVAGAANNQLAQPRHGQMLAERGIVYVPDYAINSGGLINVAQEWIGYDREKALARAGKIYDTIDALLKRAKETHNRPEVVADHMVEEILEA